MKTIIGILKGVYKLFLLKVSNERRNNYLRRLGIKIGKNCEIHTMSFATEPYLIEIGDNVRIATGTIFLTHDGAVNCFPGEVDGGIFGRIKLGNNVFIGCNSIILLNTTIGNDCIIGAGSVVRGEFPDGSVIFGNPAQIVMKKNVLKMIFKNSPGLVRTNNLPKSDCTRLIKEHFGIS
jgi:acetyltransferase-like isoleucine patch superfamily enzyme